MIGTTQDITERRKAEDEIRQSEERLALVFNSTSDFQTLLRIESGGRFIFEALNRSLLNAVSREVPLSQEEYVGRDLAEVLELAGTPRELTAFRIDKLQEVMATQQPRFYEEVVAGAPVETTLYPVLGAAGSCTHILVASRNVSDRKRAEQIEASMREKETLLREVHHRVKNNLQIVSSLLRFQAKKIVDERDAEVLRQGQDRLRAMILVHKQLYLSPTLSDVDLGDYVRSLVEELVNAHEIASVRVHVAVESGGLRVPAETALPAGMIVTELLSNAFKHAFPNGRSGAVAVRVGRANDGSVITVEDNGVGLGPECLDGFGLKLARSLSQQIKARLTYHSHSGTKVTLEIPAAAQ